MLYLTVRLMDTFSDQAPLPLIYFEYFLRKLANKKQNGNEIPVVAIVVNEVAHYVRCTVTVPNRQLTVNIQQY